MARFTTHDQEFFINLDLITHMWLYEDNPRPGERSMNYGIARLINGDAIELTEKEARNLRTELENRTHVPSNESRLNHE